MGISQIMLFSAYLATLALASAEISVTRHPHPGWCRNGKQEHDTQKKCENDSACEWINVTREDRPPVLKVSGMEPKCNGTYTRRRDWYEKSNNFKLGPDGYLEHNRILKWCNRADRAHNICWVMDMKGRYCEKKTLYY